MAARPKFPSQIPFIIGNEACERFSFYGMRNILTTFLAGSLLLYLPESERAGAAKDVFHTFVMGVYFFPLLGGLLADRLLGKYRTIFALSLLYCVGHGLLAAFENNEQGFYAGLFLIALGSGGIKPLVSSFVGDQFDRSNSAMAKVVFEYFYWSINLGSFFASLIMPRLLKDEGATIAFAVPGVLMLLATIIFVAGRKRYVRVDPPSANPHSFTRVVITALTTRSVFAAPEAAANANDAGLRSQATRTNVARGIVALSIVGALASVMFKVGGDWVPAICLGLVSIMAGVGIGAALAIDNAKGHHPDEAIDGVRVVLRILVIFALVTPFWSLFDQKASTWVVQAGAMSKPSWFEPAQMQMLNPLLVMILIPFNSLILYPALARRGVVLSPLKKMSLGILFASFAWIVIGGLQVAMDGGRELSIVWQLLPYILLTFGEVLVSTTGLEFAYSQAPLAMKSVIMSFWNLAVTVGNLWVLLSDSAVKSGGATKLIAGTGLSKIAFLMFFFAGFAALAAWMFALYARGFKMVDNYRRDTSQP